MKKVGFYFLHIFFIGIACFLFIYFGYQWADEIFSTSSKFRLDSMYNILLFLNSMMVPVILLFYSLINLSKITLLKKLFFIFVKIELAISLFSSFWFLIYYFTYSSSMLFWILPILISGICWLFLRLGRDNLRLDQGRVSNDVCRDVI